MFDASQYGGGSLEDLPSPDTNPFLPPHAVQRIIGSGTSLRSFTPKSNSELGKASLLQMNELSRRAAGYLQQEQGDNSSNHGLGRRPTAERQEIVHAGWEILMLMATAMDSPRRGR